MTQRLVRTWGLCTLLVGVKEGEKEHLWKKQMAFWKDKWALGRLGRRCDQLWDVCLGVGAKFFLQEEIRITLGRRFMKGFKELKCYQHKTIPMSKCHILGWQILTPSLSIVERGVLIFLTVMMHLSRMYGSYKSFTKKILQILIFPTTIVIHNS